MKFLSAVVLLSLAVAFAESAIEEEVLDPLSPCGDTHDDIYDMVIDAFGEEHCVSEFQEEFGPEPSYWTVCWDNKADHFQYEVYYYYRNYVYQTNEPIALDVWDWGEGVGNIKVDFLGLLYPYPGIEREPDDNTCVDKYGDGVILETLERIKTRYCRNNDQIFQDGNGEETSCAEIGELSQRQRKRSCRDDVVAEMCPGICDVEGDCGCFDNQFPFGSDGETCEMLAGYSQKKRDNRCSRKKYKMQCPSVCDEEKCSAEAQAAMKRSPTTGGKKTEDDSETHPEPFARPAPFPPK